MPVFHVSRSIRIEAPVPSVHALVRDFKSWPSWSPWLIADPDARLDHSADGKSYTWVGPISGSGEMEVTEDSAPGAIHYRLTFLKPWKSTNRVSFLFAESGGATDVTWTMDGSLPWFMFWMKSAMSAYIGSDYDRGLRMLKDRVETGSVPSKLAFEGVRNVSATAYVGINSECDIDEIGPCMQEDFGKLNGWIGENDTMPLGAPFSIYPKWDPVKGIVRYTACIPVAVAPDELPGGFVSGTRPACQAYFVRHTGPYRHLGNAWSAGMMHARARVFTATRQFAPFETYENDPTETPEAELVTLVHLPAK